MLQLIYFLLLQCYYLIAYDEFVGLKHFFWIIVLFTFSAASGQTYSVKGKVIHFKSGVQHAVVVLDDSLHRTTDKQGDFMFSGLPRGAHKLLVTHTQYKPVLLKVEIGSDTTLPVIDLQESIYELKELVVSENRREKARKDNALNLEVVNADFIRKNLSGSLMQTLEKIPGVNAMTIGSGQSKPQIRGLGFNQVVVVDGGIKHEGQQWGADHGLEIDQFAAGSVEILKGAASYLYGSDAIGGIIRVNPPLPPALHSLNVALNSSYMSNSRAVGNSLNFSARQHSWYVDARATVRDYGDYRVPTELIYVYDYDVHLPGGYVRNSAGRERNFHLALGRITENYQTRLSVSNVFAKSGFFANAHGLEPRRVNTALHDASHRDIQLPQQQVNHFKVISNTVRTAGKHELSLDAAYQQNLRKERSPYVSHGFMPPVFPDPFPYPSELERQYDKQVVSGSLRDKLSLKNHQLTLGGNYEYQENEIGGWGFLIPAFTQHQAGLFAYDKWEVSNKTIIHGALRYDGGHIRIREYTDWFPSGQDGTSEYLIRVQATDRSFHNLNWSLGANYSLGKTQLKLNLGTSFRMPLAKELAANGVNYHYFRYERGNSGLSPEKSYQLDLGVFHKTEKLELEFTPFYNYFPNYIYLNPTAGRDYLYGAGNQVFEYQQSRVMRYGAEALVRYHFTKRWTAQLSGDYLYNRQLSGSKTGFNLPFSPPPSASGSISWLPGARHPKIWKDSHISLDIKHALKQDRIVPPERVTPAYTVLGLSAGTELQAGRQKWSLDLQVNNLLNTRYLNHTSFYRLIDLPETGRNITVNLRIPLSFAI